MAAITLNVERPPVAAAGSTSIPSLMDACRPRLTTVADDAVTEVGDRLTAPLDSLGRGL